MLSALEFLWLGREQWRTYRSPLVRAFVRSLGPLGVHGRIRNAHVIHIIETMDLPPRANVLDAGCGHAYTLFWLARRQPNWRLFGIDSDAGLLEHNRQIASVLGLSNLQFRTGDAGQGEPGLSHNLIFSVHVLEHIEDDVETLTAWRHALARQGHLLLHVPLHHQMQKRVFPAFKKHTISDHVRDEYTEQGIRTKLAQAGFVVRSLTYGFGPLGELAFELNYLFWQRPWLRASVAVATFPLAILLGYLDSCYPAGQGNSLVILAQPS